MTEFSANPNGINQGFFDHFACKKVRIIDFPNETLLETRLDLTLGTSRRGSVKKLRPIIDSSGTKDCCFTTGLKIL